MSSWGVLVMGLVSTPHSILGVEVSLNCTSAWGAIQVLPTSSPGLEAGAALTSLHPAALPAAKG